MNSGDVFILDTEEAIFQWNGTSSNAHEKSQAAQFCLAMRGDRGGSPKIHTFDEGQSDYGPDAQPMWKELPGEMHARPWPCACVCVACPLRRMMHG